MTASTPIRLRSAAGRNIVGIPPPPAQITTDPLSSSQRIGRISMMRLGKGDGTTRRQESPSCLKVQDLSAASRSACSLA